MKDTYLEFVEVFIAEEKQEEGMSQFSASDLAYNLRQFAANWDRRINEI